MSMRLPSVFLVGFLIPVSLAEQACGQVVLRGAPVTTYWEWYGPVDALTARVYAHSELVRSAAAVNFQQARVIRAEAVAREIRNSVDRVQAYWDRKAINEAERLKRAVPYLERKKMVNYKAWDRLKHHPELIGSAIVDGRAQNFLLQRLGGTALAYTFADLSLEDDTHLRSQLSLSPETLHGLRLRRRHTNGQHVDFRADEGVALDVSWWPFVLRADEFQNERGSFERARAAVVEEAGRSDKIIGNESLKRLDDALLEMFTAFQKSYPRERIRQPGGFKLFRQYRTAELFLSSLDGEIGRLKTTGDARALDGSLRFEQSAHGSDLISLLIFMARNGLEFAPAKPQEQEHAAYHTVFAMMRDVYALVADEDTSLQERRKDIPVPPASSASLPPRGV